MADRKTSTRTVADCVRARYGTEGWFIRAEARGGEVRLLVKPGCPFNVHRPVLDTPVVVEAVQPEPPKEVRTARVEAPRTEAPRTGPELPKREMPQRGKAATESRPGKKRGRTGGGGARDSIRSIRRARGEQMMIDVARIVRYETSLKRPSLTVCEKIQGKLKRTYGLSLQIRRLDFGFADHHVLETKDGMILDPTADQFRDIGLELPAVYLGPMPEVYRRWMEDAGRGRESTA